MPDDLTILVSDLHMDLWEEFDGADVARAKRKKYEEFLDWVLKVEPYRFVINGDLLDAPERTEDTLFGLCQSTVRKVQEMIRAGIKVGYVVGNHDCGAIGLASVLDDPPIRIDYPCMLADCSGRTVLIEHGHLHDPFLDLYIRDLVKAMEAEDFEMPPVWTLKGSAKDQGEARLMDENELLASVHRGMQLNRDERGLDPQEVRHLVDEVLAPAFEEDHSDVMEPAEAAQWQEEGQELVTAVRSATTAGDFHLVAPPSWDKVRGFFEELVLRYYSGPHWRKAARSRANQLAAPDKPIQVAGVIMGHTHYPDSASFQTDYGDVWYANAGTWRGERGGIVLIKDGELHFDPKRRWNDPWPKIPQ